MVFLWNITESKAIGFMRIVHGREKIVSMAVSPEDDRAVCFLSSGRVCVITLGKLECALSCKIADGIDGRRADPLGPKPLTVILKNVKRCYNRSRND